MNRAVEMTLSLYTVEELKLRVAYRRGVYAAKPTKRNKINLRKAEMVLWMVQDELEEEETAPVYAA